MIRASLHLRLFAAGAASVLAALALAAFGLSLLFNAHLERRAVADLDVQLDQVLAGLDTDADNPLILATPPGDPRFSRPLSGLYWQVEANGKTQRSRSLWDYTLPLPPDQAINGTLYTFDLPGPGGGAVLVVERLVRLPARLGHQFVRVAVAMDRAELTAEGASFVSDMVPYLGLLATFLIIAGWAQIAIGLRPLAHVGARVAAVRSGQSTRLGADFPTEVRPLAAEVDALIEAREQDVQRARARAGDLAHGLKTPLQALYGEAGRLRDQNDPNAAEAIETIARAMHAHVDRELARTRIAASAPAATCDLAAVLGRVLSVVRRTPDGSRLEWTNAVPPGLAARIDPDDLTEALGALVENAARHAASRVTLTAARIPDGLTLCIADDGPGIPEDSMTDLLARGARLDTSGAGSGLGLSIASEIIDAAGGQLALSNANPGLTARVTLPEAAA